MVNSDAGSDGKQIVDGLVSGLNPDQFEVRVLSADEANGGIGQGEGLRSGADTRPTSRRSCRRWRRERCARVR